MRKSLVALIAAALALTVTSVALAVGATVQHFEVGVSPSKAGTTKKPKPITLKLHLSTTTTDGSQPYASNHVVIYMARGLIFNGAKFKSCSLATLNDQNQGPKSCPAGSKIGGGTATGNIGQNTNEQLTVTLFNGPKGKSIEVYLHGTTPAAIDAAFESKLVPIRSGAYGYKLVTDIPQNLYEPVPGLFTPLTDFNVTTKASTKVKGVTYGITATTSCTKHKWPFRATWQYVNSPSPSTDIDTVDTTVACS